MLSGIGTPRHWGMPIRVAMAGFGSSLQMVVLTNGQVAQYHIIRSPNGRWSAWDDINARVDFNRAGFNGTVLQEVTAVTWPSASARPAPSRQMSSRVPRVSDWAAGLARAPRQSRPSTVRSSHGLPMRGMPPAEGVARTTAAVGGLAVRQSPYS
ncbi:hypothetical protein ACWERW_27320 [Streptomyces sp. NPDC004012]